MKTAIILAAGDGKRMNSAKPKVLAEVLFTPMLVWALDNAMNAGIDKIGVIVGNGAELIKEKLGGLNKSYNDNIEYFEQTERLGTAHAVLQALPLITATAGSDGDVLVMCGDAPFMESEYINNAYNSHKANDNAVTVVSADCDTFGGGFRPTGYGRIVRDGDGNRAHISIVEEKDCTPAQREITEINSGTYWFSAEVLADILPRIGKNNNSGEYYLTDAVAIAQTAAMSEITSKAGVTSAAGVYNCGEPSVVLGANDRRSLRELNDIAAAKIIDKHLANGVEIIGTNIYIGKDVTVGADTTILANCILRGTTAVGCDCVIGMNTVLDDCAIGNDVILDHVIAASSTVGDDARVGPFAQLRPGTILHNGVKIGDFVEIKNSEIGEKTSVAHLTYIGDSDVGSQCNFGCGCVTANYDGLNKYRTEIGDRCFVGCNTNLIAPVKIGDDVITAAGTTITHEVASGSLAIGRSREKVLEGWAYDKFRNKKYK